MNKMNIHPEKMMISVYRPLQENETLFDFETPITEDVFIVNSSSQIYRKKKGDSKLSKMTQVVTKEQAMNGDMPNFEYEMLLNLATHKDQRKTQFQLSNMAACNPLINWRDNLHRAPFICLNNHGRSNQLKSYQIHKGDVIKLGKIFFEVVQTHFSKQEERNISRLFEPILPETELALNARHPVNKICRICLIEGENEKDLISPCDCKGSCEYVHFECLQTWIQSKVRRQENRLVSIYTLSKLQCELCKKDLPNKIKMGNKENTLIDFQWPSTPFIVLERLNENSNGKIYAVITPNGQEIKLGRNSNMEIRINDLSISRHHASIVFKEGSFELRDEGSKFGSLILLRKQVMVDQFMCLQIGSKVYKFESTLRRARNNE